jgi:hypothetical protein
MSDVRPSDWRIDRAAIKEARPPRSVSDENGESVTKMGSRMGRPPKGDRPMTRSEIQKRYVARKIESARVAGGEYWQRRFMRLQNAYNRIATTTSASHAMPVEQRTRLANLLEMLASNNEGEVRNAAAHVADIRTSAGKSWADLLDVNPPSVTKSLRRRR